MPSGSTPKRTAGSAGISLSGQSAAPPEAMGRNRQRAARVARTRDKAGSYGLQFLREIGKGEQAGEKPKGSALHCFAARNAGTGGSRCEKAPSDPMGRTGLSEAVGKNLERVKVKTMGAADAARQPPEQRIVVAAVAE